ncbi:unnamed protein product [Sphenostylis stenocarpa]|uniref:Uncharacterized protein n=1 Tax=Sphenostylis stenocarpa TaxID=92480 RepID=A0AA86SVR7_9FABA|nr:unnamed protein product [Sphenostylis stenocarpa]
MVAFRNRYMVMEVFLNPNREKVGDHSVIITQFNVSKAVRDSILENFGECGLASSLDHSKVVKYVNPITKVCIIRVSREEYQKVWSAITMVTNIGNCPVVFNLLDLSERLNEVEHRMKTFENSMNFSMDMDHDLHSVEEVTRTKSNRVDFCRHVTYGSGVKMCRFFTLVVTGKQLHDPS